MRISITASGDSKKILRYSKISEQELEKLVNDLAKLLADKGHEIIIIPSKGLSYEIAKAYKKYGGKKVIGLVPARDKKYGIKHLESQLNILDEKIELDTWYETSSELAASGDICIVIGISPGIMRIISPLKYKYKFKQASTKLIWFRNTISSPIHPEIEEDIPITYINSVKDLEKII